MLPIHLPPLRDRREDIPLLVDQFVRQFNRELGRSVTRFTPLALERLKSHAWPGNVRELENRVKQAMVMVKGDIVDVEAFDLVSGSPHAGGAFPTFKKAKDDFVRSYLVQCLQMVKGNVAAAARLAGKDRKDFYDLMKRHHVDPTSYRS